MLGKNNTKEQHRREIRSESQSRYALKKVSKGVASVLVGFTLSGQILPVATSFVHAEEASEEASESITVENFQLTHIGNNEGAFYNRVGAQIELSIDQALSGGDTIALDIYQDSDAYENGDVDQVRRFNVDTETPIIVNDGEEDITVGTYDGEVLTFNESIEDLEDVTLTVHLGTIVEPSYVYYYETVEEAYTEVVDRPIRTVYDENMDPDAEPEIIVEGSDGERTITEEVTYRLGDEVEGTRRVISNEVTTEPEEQVIAVGVESENGNIEVPEDPLADLEVEESNPNEAEEMYEEDGLSEAELIEAYNARGVNHMYHVHVDGERLDTTAIGFVTPSSMEIRNERAQNTEDATGQYSIREDGRIHTQLTFADVFAVASEQEDFDGSETLRVELNAEDGHRFSQNQPVTGHVLELTDAAFETEDGVEGSDVIVEPEANRLQTDARVAELDVNLRYVDNDTVIADIALGDVDVAELGDRLLVLEGVRSTATGDIDDVEDNYEDILSTIDENTRVRASYGTTDTGFNELFSVTAPASDNAVGYVFDSVNAFGSGELVGDDIEVVSESYEEEIPYETVETEDDTLLEGETVVDTEGVPGVVWVTENVTYVNGEETERVEASREVLEEPVMEEVRVGTGQVETTTVEEVVDTIPYETEQVERDDLPLGLSYVQRVGQVGQVVELIEIDTFNGEEVDRRVVDTRTTEPVNEIVVSGTQEAPAVLGIPDLDPIDDATTTITGVAAEENYPVVFYVNGEEIGRVNPDEFNSPFSFELDEPLEAGTVLIAYHEDDNGNLGEGYAVRVTEATPDEDPTEDEPGEETPGEEEPGEEAPGEEAPGEDIIFGLPAEETARFLEFVNTASFEELQAVPYVGEARAEIIVEHREANGPFETLEAFENVLGIDLFVMGSIATYLFEEEDELEQIDPSEEESEVDPETGEDVGSEVDPETGEVVGSEVDPETGEEISSENAEEEFFTGENTENTDESDESEGSGEWFVETDEEGEVTSVTTPEGETLDTSELSNEERAEVEEATGETLPATATATPTILAIGASLLGLGGGLTLWNKKKQTSDKSKND